MLVTGKGYPDHNTRVFLNRIFIQKPEIPILYMGDFDPYGIDIYMQYCFGNKKSIYEDFELPSIYFLGLEPRDFGPQGPGKRIDMSVEEISKLHELLNLEIFLGDAEICKNPESDNMEEEQRFQRWKIRELKDKLHYMMFTSSKYELEALGDLTIDYIEFKLKSLLN